MRGAYVFLVSLLFVPAAGAQFGATPAAALNGLRVSGNQLVDGSGNVVHLQGVNRSGTEYACVQGWGIFDGPSGAASVKPAYAGANYQNAIVNYVNLLHSYGMYAEISLIWGAPGT